jgi:hypothetical protein
MIVSSDTDYKHISWFQTYKLQNMIFFIMLGRNVLICFVSIIMHWQKAIKNIHDISKILQYIMQNSYLYLHTTKIQVTVAMYSSWNNSIRFPHKCKVKFFFLPAVLHDHILHDYEWSNLICRPSTYITKWNL